MEDPDVSNTTFRDLDLTTFIGLGDLDLEVTGQLIESERAVLEGRLVEPRRLVPPVWESGAARDTVTRQLAHEPLE